MYMAGSTRKIQCRYHIQTCNWMRVCSDMCFTTPRPHRHNRGCSPRHIRSQAKINIIDSSTYSRFSMLSLKCVFSIGDIKTASRPLIWLLFSVLLVWINKGFHAVWVGAFIFLKVHHIELVGEAFLDVSSREIKPLGVVESIEIEV